MSLKTVKFVKRKKNVILNVNNVKHSIAFLVKFSWLKIKNNAYLIIQSYRQESKTLVYKNKGFNKG